MLYHIDITGEDGLDFDMDLNDDEVKVVERLIACSKAQAYDRYAAEITIELAEP